MKNLIFTISILFFNPAFAQVIFGDTIGTVPAGQKESVLLEFASGQNKGLILPYVRTLPSGSRLSEGTIVVDATDPAKAKIRYYNGVIDINSSDGWFDLSNGNTADISIVLGTQPSAAVEGSQSKMVIGADSSAADGVLVLESDTKAMVLPMVDNTDDVPDPAPGMLVYINKEGTKRLAIYNGNAWTYWKPNDQ